MILYVKCCSLMWINQPSVTLLYGRTQNQMVNSNVCQPMTKCYSLMEYPLYIEFSPINTTSQANQTRNQLTITNQIKNRKSHQIIINQIRNLTKITTDPKNQLRNQIKRLDFSVVTATPMLATDLRDKMC